ncbi:MAG TPA: hypothetical protein VF339_01320 [Gammaproteobacteria bacterium]
MDAADEILELVRTVAGLPREDQNRILRLVDLLSLAPYPVQQRSNERLRELLDSDPQSKLECVDSIDDLIDFLERAVAGAEDRSASWSGLTYALLRGTTQ